MADGSDVNAAGDIVESLLRFKPRIVPEDELRAIKRDGERELRRDRLRQSGIRRHLSDGDPENGVPSDERMILDGLLKPLPPVRLVRLWGDRWETGQGRSMLWMNGPRGIGKTLAAGERIAEWGGRYMSFQQLIRDTQARDRGTRDAQAQWARSYAGQHLVVLDEVGLEEERQKDHARIALHEFVEVRRRRATPTIILSNKRGDVIRERFRTDWYDKRTQSRLAQVLFLDAAGKGLHDVGGEDLRGDAI
jgi:hypothetical protein